MRNSQFPRKLEGMTSTQPSGHLFTITGPSGAGKDTLMHALIEHDKALSFFPTATTRDPRAGEVDGVDYHFLDEASFKARMDEGDILEWSHHYGNYYGTLKSVVEEGLDAGKDLITDITYSGVEALYNAFSDRCTRILILPPSIEELERRFANRQKNSMEPDEAIQRRLGHIRDDLLNLEAEGYMFANADMRGSNLNDYDIVITNADLETAIKELQQALVKVRG